MPLLCPHLYFNKVVYHNSNGLKLFRNVLYLFPRLSSHPVKVLSKITHSVLHITLNGSSTLTSHCIQDATPYLHYHIQNKQYAYVFIRYSAPYSYLTACLLSFCHYRPCFIVYWVSLPAH
jgi:hypothetical protein